MCSVEQQIAVDLDADGNGLRAVAEERRELESVSCSTRTVRNGCDKTTPAADSGKAHERPEGLSNAEVAR
jgi:hypothetical protein